MLTSINNAEKVRVPGERLYKEDIYGKDLNVLQAKSLQRLSLTADVKGIIKLIGENINIDINTMFFDDFKYLIHWFRLKSFANFPYRVDFECPFCNAQNSQPIKSDNLIIDDVPEELNEEGGALISLENFPNGLFIRAPKIGDEFITEAMMKKHNISEKDMDTRAILMDLNLFRNKVNGMEIEELFKSYKENMFTPDDLMIIEAFRHEFSWGVRDSYKMHCEHCKEEVIVEDPLDITKFFLPVEPKRLVRNRILSGVPTKTTDNTSGGDVSP